VKTDSKGVFQFVTGQKLPFSLIVSIVGYQTRHIVVDHSPAVIELTPRLEALDQVVVTARRRKEQLQDVPIPVSIIRGAALEDAGAFNVNRLKELVPTVQLYASNARNTTLNIRGLGSTYGLTNDGIDPGVGFYLDGVYIARPAATWLDFIDIDQIEVLRGPQGTLFGKNTTAGAFNITSRLPQFTPEANVEVSYGNQGFIQAKTSISGPLAKNLAARASFLAHNGMEICLMYIPIGRSMILTTWALEGNCCLPQPRISNWCFRVMCHHKNPMVTAGRLPEL
jgi:iron complex outermembrane receptor protein